MNVIIYGASGMVGMGVLIQTLKQSVVESVLVVGRRTCGISNQKMRELIHDDFYNFSKISDQLKGFNACFFCLGVSSIGMSENDYKRVTYDLTMGAAKILAELNPGMTFCYVSGEGTDSTERGRMMWARIKGKTENDLLRLPFRSAYMFRPGLIKPLPGQQQLKMIFKILGYLYPVIHLFFPRLKLQA